MIAEDCMPHRYVDDQVIISRGYLAFQFLYNLLIHNRAGKLKKGEDGQMKQVSSHDEDSAVVKSFRKNLENRIPLVVLASRCHETQQAYLS
jgi:hypothetical protein